MIRVEKHSFNEDKGYFKIELNNNDKLLLTRNEFSNLKIKDNHIHLLFESTSGKFYKPFTLNSEVCFKLS